MHALAIHQFKNQKLPEKFSVRNFTDLNSLGAEIFRVQRYRQAIIIITITGDIKVLWQTVVQVAEVRSFGKNVVIGEKNCDTMDLFAAQRQSLSISLNATGSIKLGLVVKWM